MLERAAPASAVPDSAPALRRKTAAAAPAPATGRLHEPRPAPQDALAGILSRAGAARGARGAVLGTAGGPVLQRRLVVAGQAYDNATRPTAMALVGTGAARANTWREAELRQRVGMLADGDATHNFASALQLENSLILDMAIVAVGRAWATAGHATNSYEVDRVNDVARDLQALFAPTFGPGGQNVTVSLLGFDFQRVPNPTGGFWFKAVRNNRTNKNINLDVGNYPRLSVAKARSLLLQIEQRAHATVHEEDLDSLMALIVALVAEPNRWAGQNLFTALAISQTLDVPQGRALTGDVGILPMSAGSTWDERALARQDLARTRAREALISWQGSMTAFNGLAADFDGAASLPLFEAAAVTRIEGML